MSRFIQSTDTRPRLLVWVFGAMDKRGSFEDYVLRIARGSHQAGFDVDVVAGLPCDPNLMADLAEAGASLTAVPLDAKRNLWHFVRTLWLRRPAVVHCHFGSPSTVMAPLARLFGVRAFVFTDHGSRTVIEPQQPRRLNPMHLRRRLSAGLIDLFLPVSAFVGDMLRREVHASADRVVVLPNGIDLSRTALAAVEGKAAIRRRLGLPVDAKVVLFVGTVCEAKGAHDLLSIQLQADGNAVVVWVGKGPLYPAVKQTEGQRVRVLGPRSDVPDLLRAADLLVAPSRWFEAFSLVLAEAAASGLPVVASRIGGIPEVAPHNETGLLVTPGDRAQLTDAILRLLRDPALRQTLGATARSRAASLFDLDQMVAATLGHYRRLLTVQPQMPAKRAVAAITEPVRSFRSH